MRTELTKDVILSDYNEVESDAGLGALLLLGVVFFCLCVSLISGLDIDTFMLSTSLIVMAAFLPACMLFSDKNDRKQMQRGEYSITEEAITRKVKKSDADEDYYYIFFETVRLRVSPQVSYPYKPSYAEARIGDRYYMVKTPNRAIILAYSQKQWYINDIAEENCVHETAEKRPLIFRVMECEQYPKLTYRSKHYSEESKSYAQKIMNKPGQERDFLEELAARRFYGDIMTALEYIVRYCPALLWYEVKEELSDSQRELVSFVIAHVKAEEKDKKCKEKYAE